MKVVLLSGGASVHTHRWANGLDGIGIEVYLVSQQPLVSDLRSGVNVFICPNRGALGYFSMALSVRKLIKKIKPDIVNAHYASGYGTTAHLVNFRPWLLSVWGSDVYDFPYKSPIHHWGVASNLRAADAIASTSRCMADQTRKLAPHLGDIAITPFGVDCEQFTPVSARQLLEADHELNQPIVVGTVKTLAYKYGIDILIKAFALARYEVAKSDIKLASRLRLRIVGEGPSRVELEQLAAQQQIGDAVIFVGDVPHSQVPDELRQLDIYVALSRDESFGVAVIEAGAVGLPVVVSDVGGLPEVVKQNKTGLIVPRENPQAAANALVRLIHDFDLRAQLGNSGRLHVLSNYSWDASLQNMLTVYERVIAEYKNQVYEGR